MDGTCNSDMPFGLNFFYNNRAKAKFRNNPTELVGTTFGTIYIFERNNDAPGISETIERKADSALDKENYLMVDIVGLGTDFDGDHNPPFSDWRRLS